MIALVKLYRKFISPIKPPCCRFTPTCSAYAIEGITSPDGRVLGKMGHNERTLGTGILGCSEDLIKNVAFSGDAANKASSCQNIFAAGVSYFA